MSFGLIDPNDPRWPEVERRAALLRDLLRQSDWKVTAEVANAALAQLGMPRSTLFRAVARFRRTRRASSLLPLKRGTRDGSSQLDPRIERIIEEQIERFWLKKEKPRFSALMERVHDACHVEGLRAPHRKTIKRRVMKLNPLVAARRRGQGGLGGKPRAFVADRPNVIWQSTILLSILSSSMSNIDDQSGVLC
jgi:putative transposase